MIVKELIKELKNYDLNQEVFLSRDIEGNGINEIYEVAITQDGKYLPSKEGVEGAIFIGGSCNKWKKWIRTKDYLTIYPSDTCVSQ